MSNTLGIRMSVTPEMALANQSFTDADFVCCNNLYDLWLKLHGIEVLEKTFGVHLTSGKRQHFHLHYILGNDFSFKTAPLQRLKSDLLCTTKKHSHIGEQLHDYLNTAGVDEYETQDIPYPFSRFMLGCISIKCKKIPFMEATSLTYNDKRFLSYPFKERYRLDKLCNTNYDLQELEDLAASEYQAVQVKREKAINATIKTQGHQQHVFDYLESRNHNAFSNPVPIVRDALHYFKQQGYPYQKTCQHALQWTYDNGQLPLDTIIYKSLPGLKDNALINLSANGDLPTY